MNNISRRSFVAGGTLGLLTLAGCGGSGSGSAGSSSTDGDDKTYKIGVLQLTEHPALDAANDGIVAALDDSGIKYVGTAITDYAASGLVADNDAPGGNLTGSSDMNPVDEQIAMLQKVLPDAKHVGMLYCTAEANSVIQVEMAEAACDAAGLTHDRYTVSSSNEVQSVVESMVGKVDAAYAPTDNTIAAAAAQIGQIAKEGKLPIVAGEENMCSQMGICTLSIDYEELGRMAGKMGVEILTEGKKPADMPIQHEDATTLKVVKNEEMAEALGIDLSVLDA